MTPQARSVKALRADGWLVAVVEKWNPWCKIRQDLFGFADLLAVRGNDVVLLQVTSGSNVSARVKKIEDNQAAAIWLESPTRSIYVQGWRKAGARGKRKLWECRTIEISPSPEGSKRPSSHLAKGTVPHGHVPV